MNTNFLIINMKAEGITGAVSRVLGISLKEKIISEFDQTKYSRVILDFSGVDFVTSGFAKELFGGLYEQYKNDFNHLLSVRIDKDNESLKNTIIRAIATVIKEKN
jgi:hypothetical protein